jgi:hypothetical protein
MCSSMGVRSGAALLVLRHLDRTLPEGRGLFTVLCATGASTHGMRRRPSSSPTTTGEPWFKWGCPLEGCGWRSLGPEELEGHTAAEHPGWVATYKLVWLHPNQLQRILFRRVEPPPAS